jgi:AcrR family transcriptional regulator
LGHPGLPCPNCKTCAGQSLARHSAELSASSFVPAAELFSKQGYASTSTRSISTLIGMEKATLYYHVKSKEDLLYLITKSSVEALQEEVQKAIEGITSPLDQLAAAHQAHIA